MPEKANGPQKSGNDIPTRYLAILGSYSYIMTHTLMGWQVISKNTVTKELGLFTLS